jgi:type V secretory pathway adhesin AidA
MVKTATVFVLLSMAAALPVYSQTVSPGGPATPPSHAATPAPNPTASPSPSGVAPSAAATQTPGQPASPAPSSAPSPRRTRSRTPASNQFATEQAAKAHCPGDTIVWVNLGGSKNYHTSSDRYYGKTRRGAYMCQKEADAGGYHPPGHRPSRAAAKSTSAKSPQ